MYINKDTEIARVNIQKLNEFNEKQTLDNITAIAFQLIQKRRIKW